MNAEDLKIIENVANEIISLGPRVDRAIKSLTDTLNRIEGPLDETTLFASAPYWQAAAVRDGMIKVHITIEQNFRYLETFGVLAITRYIFELLIWFRLLTSGDAQYAFRCAKDLMTDNWNYAREQLSKLKSEIQFFKQLGARERDEIGNAAKTAIERDDIRNPDQFGAASRMISEEIDRAARRGFCLHADGAKTNGYGLQAHLLETQGIPVLEKRVKEQEEWKDKAITQMPTSMQKQQRWRWDEMAKAVGMGEQYDFLYRYTSRLLHASPISFSKGPKNLDTFEVRMFLDFVFVSIVELAEISERLAGVPDPQAN
jgi:hypothetical protein